MKPPQNMNHELKILGYIVVAIFLGLVYQWGISVKESMDGLKAIEMVKERTVTNLIEGAAQTDGRSYDWIAKRASRGVYYVKHNLVLDRMWRFDRWENYCWVVKRADSEVKMVGCRTIGWDRGPSALGLLIRMPARSKYTVIPAKTRTKRDNSTARS